MKKFALAALLAVAAVVPAQAGSVNGSKAVADIGATSADTGDIFTATTFTFGLPVAAVGGTDDFATYAPGLYFLTATTLDLNNIGTFTIGNAAMGTFTGSAVFVDAVGATSKAFYIAGMFQPGSDFPGGLQDPSAASLTISFTQVSGPGSTISASGTLRTPPAERVPEPATIATALMGAAAFAFARLRRKGA